MCVCAWLVNISFLAKEQISIVVESVHLSAVVVFQASFSSPGSMSCICLTAVLFSALQVAFGSLYRDDVLIKPSRVVALLAAACMLQLVSNKCAVFVRSPVR